MSRFQFKQFSLAHDKSSMKVGTDAVLLGSLTAMDSAQSILEIGCGSGVISLMAAQKSKAKIMGIDIDKNSVEQARENFSLSPWKDQLMTEHISFQDFANIYNQKYDLIISNPPFFEDNLKSPSEIRNKARHNDSLSFSDLLSSTRQLLQTHGRLAVVLPFTEGERLIQLASSHSFFLKRRISIYPKPSKKANRLILEFVLRSCNTHDEELTIREENNEYTAQYRHVTKDFYLAF